MAVAAIIDWRTADSSQVLPLIQAEVEGWRTSLAWDVASAWRGVEPARLAGRLPGLMACDRQGQVIGWTAYLVHHGHLQVIALVADDPAVAGALLDGVLASPEARRADCTIVSVRDRTPELARLLERSGFVVDRHQYLLRDLQRCDRLPPPVPHWRDCNEAMAELCAVAYRDHAGVRAFAPGSSADEWRHYISALVSGQGCGAFLPELSGVVPLQPSGGAPAGLQAALMLTDLGGRVAHIAQLVVRPSARGRGLARRLVSAAVAESSRFFDRMSLLVSGQNTAALRLYEATGFRIHAPFIVARLDDRTV